MNVRRPITDSADLSWSMVQQGPGDPPPPVPPMPPTPPPVPPQPPAQVRDPAAEVSRLHNEIANVRAEAAGHRINERNATEQVAAANARIAELQAEMTRREEAARAAGASEVTKWMNMTMDAKIHAAAIEAGLVDPILLPLIDKRNIVMAADGTITGIAEAVAAFKTAKPSFFRDAGTVPPAPPASLPRAPGAPSAPPINPSPPAQNVKDMPKAEYAAAKRAAISGLRRLG